MKITNKLLSDKFIKNMTLLTTGSFLGQIIAVLSAPIITRLYGVQDIGVHAYIISIVSMFTPIMNFRYDMAIVPESNEENIYPIIKLCVLVGIALSSIISLFILLYFKMYKKMQGYTCEITVIMFFLLLSSAFINILNSVNNRLGEYKVLTAVSVIRNCSQHIGGIFLGIFHCNFLGLLFPYLFGQCLGIKHQAMFIIKNSKRIWGSDTDSIKIIMKKYKQLPMYSVPAMFANSFSYSSVTMFIEFLFDMTTVGYYSVSSRILGLPLSLISGNVAKIFFQESSREYNQKGHFDIALRKSLYILLFMTIPLSVVIYHIAPWACKTFFGDSWSKSADYVIILTPYFMCRFVGTALSPALIVCNKQRIELLVQFILLSTSILSYFINSYYMAFEPYE